MFFSFGPVISGGIFPKFARPGISPEMLEKAGVRHVTAHEARELCGCPASGLYLPYFRVTREPVLDGGKPYGRLRLDAPEGDKKYHQQAGTAVHVYVPPGASEQPPGGDLYIIEGEFKAVSLCEAGFAAVGISGFFGFSEKGGENLVVELAEVIQRKRPDRILFVGDSDTALNFQFSVAALRLLHLVAPIPVALVRIPIAGPGKGADDCREALARNFHGFWIEQVAHAVRIGSSTHVAALAVNLALREQEGIAKLTGEDRDTAEQRMVKLAAMLHSHPIEEDKIIGLAVSALKLARSTFKRAVKKQVQKNREERAAEVTPNVQGGEPQGRRVYMDLQTSQWTMQMLEAIAPETYFYGDHLCAKKGDELDLLTPADLCSFVDDPRRVFPYTLDRNERVVHVSLKEADMRVLAGAARQNPDIVRIVETISKGPVLVLDGSEARLVRGYCRKTRILAGEQPMGVLPLDEAIRRVRSLFCDYQFKSAADASRAWALLITPALGEGGFLGSERSPLFVVEKNEPTAGASLLIKLVAQIYGSTPTGLTRTDDPHSFMEQVSARLLAGDNLLYVDNARGRGLENLPAFESLLTEPNFLCRIPYKQGTVDVTRRVFAVSTNGAVFSRDLSTRSVKIGIIKRPKNHAWHPWPEGSVEAHARANALHYREAIYSMIVEWCKRGMPLASNPTGFRFGVWVAKCGGILEHGVGMVPLLDAEHEDAQQRLADPDHDLLRSLCRVVCAGEMRRDLSATDLAEIAVGARLMEGDPMELRMKLGKALQRRFDQDGEFIFDTIYRVTRSTRVSSFEKAVKSYRIERVTPSEWPSNGPDSSVTLKKPNESPTNLHSSPTAPRENPDNPRETCFKPYAEKIFFEPTEKILCPEEEEMAPLGEDRGFSGNSRETSPPVGSDDLLCPPGAAETPNLPIQTGDAPKCEWWKAGM